MRDGRIAFAEPAKGIVAAIDAKTGKRSEIAAGLPLSTAGLRVPSTTPAGLAVGADGGLYVAGSADNSIRKVTFPK